MPLGTTPHCFGKEWKQDEPECAGGRDPNFTDPNTGTHIRERCDFFTSCGARTQAAAQAARRLGESERLIPASNLTRPSYSSSSYQNTPARTYSPGPPNEAVVQQLTAQLAQAQQQIQNLQQNRNYGSNPYYGQNVQNVQHMAMDMSVPRYLTVPEPQNENTSIWVALGRSVFRSAMKSVGHTIANFWDHTPIDRGKNE